MIKKILIANRGEIVNRIIRTCERMNIETVAIYSKADEGAEYLEKATQSISIGESAPNKSYLNIDALVDAIKSSGVDAVHPGYGFLSESESFALAVSNAGATWIGPDHKILHEIESKSYCRTVAKKIGVPITPGTIGVIESIDEIYDVAEKVGLPILLKLDKGGGGKGITGISEFVSREETQSSFESMQRIGNMAFACGDVYVEKAISSPRHIEVQFIADSYKNVVCLGERECSIQRRYQKIIEEAPSSIVSTEERNQLYEYTKKIVKEMGYSGAGTIEYLRDDDGAFYFMEINARLQVEHPVTEMVTGIDIVEWQIRVASGEELGFKQEDIAINGHSIECRIYAEDPKTFLPSPGKIDKLKLPKEEQGKVRIEHALCEGYKVSPFYDPMLCKSIAWGENRETCIQNMSKVLNDTEITGISTSIDVCKAIMNNIDFMSGDFSTDFLSGAEI